MRKGIFLFITITMGVMLSAQQNCPEPKEENYKKVMSSAFAEEYKKCPVTIVAEYFGEGYLTNWRKPYKLKDMYFFQCVNVGEQGKPAPLSNEMAGDFFVIDKAKADLVLNLKKGDKLKLTGVTFVQNYVGVEMSTFFIVDKVQKIN
ncbi:MAG: hypothetical protein U0T75_03345 [Chitinophagales bacterium]